MRKNKSIACILLALSMMNTSVFAGTDVSLSGNKVTLSTDGTAGEWGTLYVVKSGNSLDNENIVTLKQAVADEKGNLVFNFSISDEPAAEVVNGKYDLYIKSESDTVRKEEMYYAKATDRETLADTIKVVTGATELSTILEKAENETVLKASGFDFEKYALVKTAPSGCVEFADIFRASVNADMTDSDKVTEALNMALAAELINLSTSAENSYIADFGFSFEDTDYADITDNALKTFIDGYIFANKKYTTVDEINKAYEQANILYKVNNTRFTDMESVLGKYADALGMTTQPIYTSYRSAANKADINEDIVASLKASPAVSVQNLISVISTAIASNSVYVGGGAAGSAGGSSGGNSGGNFGGNSGGSSSSNNISLFPTVTSKSVFKDLGSVSWAESAINALAEKGIVAGYENGSFDPNNTVKREEFVKMLVVAAGMHDEKAECSFGDVVSDSWYYSFVASAFNKGLVYGVSEEEFGIGNNITRQDLAVMCYRAAKEVKEIKFVREKTTFSDEASISEYAKEAVDSLYRAGVLNGVGADEFAPLATATRAQAAVMIYNLFLK